MFFALFPPLLKQSLRDEAEICHEAKVSHIKVMCTYSEDDVWRKHIRYRLCMIYAFWTLELPERVLSNHPCLSVRWSVRPSVFKYFRDHSLFFLIFCMTLGHHKGSNMTEPDFRRNIVSEKMGEIPNLVHYFFCLFSRNYL